MVYKRFTKFQMILPLPGSSHAVCLMRGEVATAVVGIRGGGVIHVKERIDFYRPRRLQTISEVVVLIGGNDLDRRTRAGEENATRKTREDMESLAAHISRKLPSARVTTLDILPRTSVGSRFNSRARAIARHVGQAGPNHHHVTFIKSLTTIDIRNHKRDKIKEKYPVVSVFYDSGDGTHLNSNGYTAVQKIVDWAFNAQKSAGSAYMFYMAGWEVRAEFKF